jgi:hypothetical protein
VATILVERARCENERIIRSKKRRRRRRQKKKKRRLPLLE